MLRFCVVIPTYNEADTIAEVVRGVEDAGAGLVVVVDDGSTDGTVQVVERLAEKYSNVVLVERGRKLGIGSAIKDGMRRALQNDPELRALVTMDADMSHDPSEVPKLVEPCEEDAVVVGSRYVEGGVIEGWGVHRRLVSKTANLIARSILGVAVRDATSGFRCYGRMVAEALLRVSRESGFVFQVEALYKAQRMGYRLIEVPITFIARRVGKSKLDLGEIFEFLGAVRRMLLWTPPKEF